ncbi:hypothetical protein FE257_009386 [Aspergillus nanangensis]|uniref:Up-regulated during septation protein 1 domain-containing protein n=1 Tax=Aspergillus nanangensis TaxID=2582783 RepID=A0AAD4GST6_ASPNN|nr:hypothetical protein FE257_009386 [Aspergillus nanangensis]
MNGFDLRSSQSSYGDPGHSSTASFAFPHPPQTKAPLDGYGATYDPQNGETSRYNPLNPTHPRSSALLNASDPVAMYLLTETAMGDSVNYEILSLEEVESLKKEYKFLSTRMDAAKRKLALEMKLRDAAMSLTRLYSSKSPRASEDMDVMESPKSHRSRRSIFGRHGQTLDKTDEELALSTRKCEELSQEVWNLERRVQQVNKRLLEHTAGVLQMTHKGLKKNSKQNNIPHTPESLSSHNTRGSMDDFDDRSLYKTADRLDDMKRDGARGLGNATGVQPAAVDMEAIQNTERKLEYLSGKMREMILLSNPDGNVELVPRSSNDGGSANPTATVESHLAYIESGLGMLVAPPSDTSRSVGLENDDTGQRLGEINNQLQYIIAQSGLPHSQTLPSPPDASTDGQASQLSYLNMGLDSIQKRVESLLEQKSILTTQIQQQRELNSKSDAERDAHIADLVEQLNHSRKDLERSQYENEQSRDELNSVLGQLEDARRDVAEYQQRSIPEDHSEALASENQARIRAEKEVIRLESYVEQLQSESQSRAEELSAVRSQSENETARLQRTIDELSRDAGDKAEDVAEARDRAEQQVLHLEQTLQQVREEADARVREASDSHAQAESQVSQLQASMDQLRVDVESQLREATEARAHAEGNTTRLQSELTDLEGEVVRAQTELTMVKAELDGAYGTRAQRAAEVALNPAIQKEIDEVNTRNIEMAQELAALKAGKPVSGDLQQRAETLEKELRETIDDYEVLTKASIEFEKERERFEGIIDELRDRCEQLETQMHEERINWMGNNPMGPQGTYETTSTMVLKNEFKKMMRDTRTENMKILRAEHDERRRLENLVRTLKKEQGQGPATSKPGSTPSVTAL